MSDKEGPDYTNAQVTGTDEGRPISNRLLAELPLFVSRFVQHPRRPLCNGCPDFRVRLPQGHWNLTKDNAGDAREAKKWLKRNKWVYEKRSHAYYPPGTDFQYDPSGAISATANAAVERRPGNGGKET